MGFGCKITKRENNKRWECRVGVQQLCLSHAEIRSAYFALCNGIEFALYRTFYTDNPILYFNIEDIDEN